MPTTQLLDEKSLYHVAFHCSLSKSVIFVMISKISHKQKEEIFSSLPVVLHSYIPHILFFEGFKEKVEPNQRL